MMFEFRVIPVSAILSRPIILSSLIIFLCFQSAVGGGCNRGGRSLCCTSKDNTCYSYEFAAGFHTGYRKCYCDASCLLTRDCCRDYYTICNVPPKHCEVSEWSNWSSCTTTCGRGKIARWRKIITLPENGGNLCPQLTEKKSCEARDCISQDQETARLLPATEKIVGTVKKYDPKYDIRRNLFKRTLVRRNNNVNSPYCVEYIVESVAANDCNSTDPIRPSSTNFLYQTWLHYLPTLVHGQKICVTCYPSYMTNKYGKKHCKGTGAFQNTTPWAAVRLPKCRGTFRMTMKPRTCECPVRGQEAKQSFVFI